MRTTLAIDDDVLAAAKAMAERERRPLGEVISELSRRGLGGAVPSRSPRAQRNGLPLLPVRKGAAPVTLELVNRLRDELP
ncbi:MAG: CopG family transcriptional regulator [Burkholderiales bacterium]|nr:CopG family transcriptional regulator [Burkholderiales bacterium]